LQAIWYAAAIRAVSHSEPKRISLRRVRFSQSLRWKLSGLPAVYPQLTSFVLSGKRHNVAGFEIKLPDERSSQIQRHGLIIQPSELDTELGPNHAQKMFAHVWRRPGGGDLQLLLLGVSFHIDGAIAHRADADLRGIGQESRTVWRISRSRSSVNTPASCAAVAPIKASSTSQGTTFVRTSVSVIHRLQKIFRLGGCLGEYTTWGMPAPTDEKGKLSPSLRQRPTDGVKIYQLIGIEGMTDSRSISQGESIQSGGRGLWSFQLLGTGVSSLPIRA